MVVKKYILNNLNILDKLFNNCKDTKRELFYSKLAILELCGWIEETMDDIIRNIANIRLKKIENQKELENNIIRRTHGFEYKNHFREMLIKTIGIINVEKLEIKVDQAKRQILEATLDALKELRNKEAHTHLKGITKTIDAPSVTKSRLIGVYNGLRDIDTKLRKLKI
jgi:hypothetical protein